MLGRRDAPQVLTSWSRLYSLLAAAFPDSRVHRGQTLAGLRQDSAGVTACFAGGAEAEGDVLVGADGIRSAGSPWCAQASGSG